MSGSGLGLTSSLLYASSRDFLVLPMDLGLCESLSVMLEGSKYVALSAFSTEVSVLKTVYDELILSSFIC